MADIRDAVYSTGVAVLNRRDMDSIKKYRHSRSRTRNQEIKNRAYIVMMRAAEEKKIKKTKKQKKSVREKKKIMFILSCPTRTQENGHDQVRGQCDNQEPNSIRQTRHRGQTLDARALAAPLLAARSNNCLVQLLQFLMDCVGQGLPLCPHISVSVADQRVQL